MRDDTDTGRSDVTAQGPTLLVIKLSSLGDLFHALPAVHALRAGLNATLDWVTQTEYVDLVGCFADVRRVIGFPRRNLRRGFPAFLKTLRGQSYDAVLDMQGLLKSAAVARLARSRRVIGPSFCREGSHLLYAEIAGVLDKRRHAVQENLDMVRHLGVEAGEPRFPVRFPERTFAEPRPRVGVLPVSRWPSKNWPLDSYATAARRLQSRCGATIFLFGSPAEAPAVNEVAKALDPERTRNLAGRTGLVEMGSCLSGMDLVITNDSGPMHMAAALGVPVLALFGPTDPMRTGPYGAGHEVITAEAVCRPCFGRTCRKSRRGGECLAAVAPNVVVERAIMMLERGRPREVTG